MQMHPESMVCFFFLNFLSQLIVYLVHYMYVWKTTGRQQPPSMTSATS
jgi:hypothetical protein